MSVEILKPIALIVCLMSLCAVFQVAFLTADMDMEQKCWESLVLMFLWAGISVSSGMIFRADEGCQAVDCMRTLPMQIFFWGAGTMVVMFFAAQYLETHCIFFRDVRRL
jgi:hypothetical protein